MVLTHFYFHTNIMPWVAKFLFIILESKEKHAGESLFWWLSPSFLLLRPPRWFQLSNYHTCSLIFPLNIYIYIFLYFNSLFIQLYSHTVLYFLSRQVRSGQVFFLILLLSWKSLTFCFCSTFTLPCYWLPHFSACESVINYSCTVFVT